MIRGDPEFEEGKGVPVPVNEAPSVLVSSATRTVLASRKRRKGVVSKRLSSGGEGVWSRVPETSRTLPRRAPEGPVVSDPTTKPRTDPRKVSGTLAVWVRLDTGDKDETRDSGVKGSTRTSCRGRVTSTPGRVLSLHGVRHPVSQVHKCGSLVEYNPHPGASSPLSP